jgi:hypothetical protein
MAHATPRTTGRTAAQRQPANRLAEVAEQLPGGRSARTRTRTRTRPTVTRHTTQQEKDEMLREQAGRDQRGRQTTRQATQAQAPLLNPGMTPAQTVQGVDRLNANTPNAEIERLLIAIDRHRRNRTPLPPSNAYRDNWEWVQFEITRRLKRAIRERDELLVRIGSTFAKEIKALSRTITRSARKAPQAQTGQTAAQSKARMRELRAA